MLNQSIIGRGDVKGFTFDLVQRTGNIAIYSQKSASGKIIGYEVLVIQNQKPWSINTSDGKEVIISGGESYPKSSRFGINAWTYKTLERATLKFNQLISK